MCIIIQNISKWISAMRGWLNHVIVPIGKKNPAALEEVYSGAALRLQTCCDYYDALLAVLHSLVD
jgi:hypothetical protein